MVCASAGAVQGAGSVVVGGNTQTINTWADELINFVVSPHAVGKVDVTLTNDSAEDDTWEDAFEYLADPSTPILTNIEANMAATIEAMATGGGYHYNWGTSNQKDKVLQDADTVAEIYLTNEDNLDEPDGVDSNSYLNAAYFEIHVQTTMDDLTNTPIFNVNAYHNKVLDDLKRCFGINYHLTNVANSIMYRNYTHEIKQNGDLFTPGVMKVIFRVDYAQDREDVTVNANT